MVRSFYLDTSVAIRIILGHSPQAAEWFDDAAGGEGSRVISSRLLRTEMTRVLRREGLPVLERDRIIDYIDIIPIDHAVLNEAEAIISHIRTLDAIHLASALRSGLEDLTIVTHDKNVATVAEQLGFAVFDPVG
ncbi:ribonuclease VapC [Nocardia neocaledoniensis NBRC 108232]|uniref:Ribonuclease VapC n=1 Tax=Nocardia neocaledoniensis TaxID=236511 RepID=A0A317NE57_9NOCA|nr:putative nucleic acid-binding protein [Nocardia neocaledoniensis]GEM33559.1 ribonuclease VapC [Nocardia neocaledoniensis NBRC 108232]